MDPKALDSAAKLMPMLNDANFKRRLGRRHSDPEMVKSAKDARTLCENVRAGIDSRPPPQITDELNGYLNQLRAWDNPEITAERRRRGGTPSVSLTNGLLNRLESVESEDDETVENPSGIVLGAAEAVCTDKQVEALNPSNPLRTRKEKKARSRLKIVAERKALASIIIRAAESEESAEFLCSPNFAARKPYAADVVRAFDQLMKPESVDAERKATIQLGWDGVWARQERLLVRLLSRPSVYTPEELGSATSAFLFLMLASRDGQEGQLHRVREMRRSLSRFLDRPFVHRQVCALEAFCGYDGNFIDFMKEEDNAAVDFRGFLIFGEDGIGPDLSRGLLTTGIDPKIPSEMAPKKLTNAINSVFKNIAYCVVSPLYRRGAGLTMMYLNWAHRAVDQVERRNVSIDDCRGNVMRLETALDKYRIINRVDALADTSFAKLRERVGLLLKGK